MAGIGLMALLTNRTGNIFSNNNRRFSGFNAQARITNIQERQSEAIRRAGNFSTGGSGRTERNSYDAVYNAALARQRAELAALNAQSVADQNEMGIARAQAQAQRDAEISQLRLQQQQAQLQAAQDLANVQNQTVQNQLQFIEQERAANEQLFAQSEQAATYSRQATQESEARLAELATRAAALGRKLEDGSTQRETTQAASDTRLGGSQTQSESNLAQQAAMLEQDIAAYVDDKVQRGVLTDADNAQLSYAKQLGSLLQNVAYADKRVADGTNQAQQTYNTLWSKASIDNINAQKALNDKATAFALQQADKALEGTLQSISSRASANSAARSAQEANIRANAPQRTSPSASTSGGSSGGSQRVVNAPTSFDQVGFGQAPSRGGTAPSGLTNGQVVYAGTNTPVTPQRGSNPYAPAQSTGYWRTPTTPMGSWSAQIAYEQSQFHNQRGRSTGYAPSVGRTQDARAALNIQPSVSRANEFRLGNKRK